MLLSVLRSERTVQVNIEIMRALVRLSSNPVNDWNGAKRLNDWNGWNGLQLKVDGAARVKKDKDRFPRGRKGPYLWAALTAAHFDVLRIIKTCKFPGVERRWRSHP
jgi:hypothetical protein